MKILLIIVSSLTFLFPGPLRSDNWSVGISETMGIYGMWNLNYDLNDYFFITTGSFIIPIIGGVGLGTRYDLSSSLISPFISAAGFVAYMVPLMCENCEMKYDAVLSGSAGLDLHLATISETTIHLQLGVNSLYSLRNNAPDESPSDIPELWPFINIKFGK